MEKNCFDCENCIYICDGDYMCDLIHEIVRVNHSEATEYFMSCKSRNKQNSKIKPKESFSNKEIINKLDCISEMTNEEIKVNFNHIRTTCKAAHTLLCSLNQTIKQLKYNNRKRKTTNKINKNLRKKLSYLLSTYEFNQEVLNDISRRLMDYLISSGNDNGFNDYLSQQIRYLQNILKGQENKTNNINSI